LQFFPEFAKFCYGKDEAVLMGIDEFADYEKYTHKKYIAQSLAEAEKAASSPEAEWLDESEFWKD
jgi:hypothetical protein